MCIDLLAVPLCRLDKNMLMFSIVVPTLPPSSISVVGADHRRRFCCAVFFFFEEEIRVMAVGLCTLCSRRLVPPRLETAINELWTGENN